MNQKFKKSQILMLSILATLLVITPFLSSSIRPTYLYFIFNLLIIALAVEAGLVSVLSKPLEDKRTAVSVVTKPLVDASHEDKASALEFGEKTKAAAMEKSFSEKAARGVNVADKEVKKCPSMPSLFFIGGVEGEADEVAAAEEVDFEVEEGDEEEEVMVPSGEELFTKAEVFIGNFHKQLKMQREESWKKIHGLSESILDNIVLSYD